MTREAGKGDKRRPTNEQKFQQNWDSIFSKQPAEKGFQAYQDSQKVVEIGKLNKELYEKTSR
ncbi:hypothetical protein UFOVP249_70 [uncultured Caudovirales phage]|uniref:Uncharacterized protein n=1 Tax=uncultured Caudovirales phage TaxID=2100421 RepID=A0A6J5LEH3_9CAUD|nr:hypothetical protein UFOVP249_70 [uncultured Caudovirales phage]